MKFANFQQEKTLWKKGYKFVIGLDEAGRGALAGPVVGAAVMINKDQMKFEMQNLLKEIKDSKKLKPQKREKLYKILINHPNIKWGIGKINSRVIDKINILEATKLAMERALRKIFNFKISIFRNDIFLILDGNFKLNLNLPQKSIIRADEKILSCAMASIIAKVYRDHLMLGYHKKYPQYGFDKHKGYGTRLHFKRLYQYGPSKIHRRTFAPVKNLQK